MKKLVFLLLLSMGAFYLNAQNNCLTFDGTDDYVNIPTEPLYNSGSYITSFTQEAWIYSSNTDANYHGIMGSQTSAASDRGPSIYVHNTTNIHFGFGDGSTWYSHDATNVIEANTWTHIAITYDGTNYSLYVNGILKLTSTNHAGHYPISGVKYIGKVDGFFSGKIDEVRIWNDARTETEIRQNMYQELSDPSSETNLVAYYKFNATSGTTLTDSKGSHTGTLTNMTGNDWTATSNMLVSKKCLNFDGSNDYVTLPSSLSGNLSGGTAITIEYWFKGAALHSAVRFQDGGGYIVAGWSDPPKFIISSDGETSGVTIGTDSEIEDGNWHHIACVWEANTTNGFRTYLDGVLKNQRNSANVSLPTISDAWLGSLNGGELLTGSLDEVRIWNTARTATEIHENMTRTLEGGESGLVAYYSLNEAVGTTVYDATSNSYNGTINGGAGWTDSESFTTWLGVTNSDWSTASNWTNGVPTSSSNVGIYKWDGNNEAAISGSPTVNSLVISSTSTPTLSSGITVNGNLLLEKDMDLNGQTITLGSSATLIEDAGVFSGTSGSVTTIRTLSNISENVAGLGAKITTSADMGSTTITRTHTSVSGYNFNSSVLRQYAISPSTNTGLNATLEFHYLDSELNSLNEANFQLLKSADGTTWNEQGGIVSRVDNTITLSGIDDFSHWTVNEYIQPMNNNALDFDGVNDYVECGNDASITSFNNFTMEAWVKLEDANNNQKILGKFKDWENYFIMGVLDEKHYSQIMAANNEINFYYGNVPTDVWTHLAVTFSKGNGGANGTCYGYVNGEVVYSKTDVVDAAISVNSEANPFRIGVAPWDVTAFKVAGQIDEVRIWNTSRTATEIRENMMRTLDGDESGLVAYYRLNETSGTTAYDATANGNNGTLTNMDGSSGWVDSEAFTTWLGGTSAAWSTATNWTDGVPTPTDNVGIYKWTGNNEATISGSPTVNSLLISSSSTPTLSSGITVNGNLLLEKNMDLNGQTITLGSSATLVEDAGVFSGTSGSITTTRTLNNISENVAGLGAKITSSADMGSTSITRTHNSVSGYNFKSSVLRQYTITPSTTTGLNATLEYNYLNSELNSLEETKLQFVKSTDGGSTWTDQGGVVSTANNTVTLSGIDGFSTWGVTQLLQPMNNNALDFDGVNDYVECGNDASITEFNNLTVEAWVKLENATNNQKIIGKFGGSFDNFYVMGVLNEEYHFEIAAGSQANRISFSAGNVPNNTWTHLAVTYSKGNGGANGTFYGYVNGELVYSKTDVADAAISVSDASYPLRIGVAPWDVNEFKVAGQIDEVRIWNTSRTATEIRENMMRTLDGDESNLVAYYRFNESSGTTAYDATSNGNNGTISGGATWANSESFTTWLGGTSAAWSTETNWTDGVPTSTDNVGLYDYGNPDPVIPTGQTVNNLVIGSSVTSQIDAGDDLSVNGNLFVFGYLTLESTASGTGSLIVDGTSSGNVTVERFMNDADFTNWKDGWHFLSSPVAAQAISPNFVTDPISNYDFYCWYESTNEWVNYKNTSTAPTWATANVISNGLAENTSDFKVGKGYMAAYNQEGTKSFSGVLNVADVAITGLDVTDGGTNSSWHLLGNPYSSGLTWDDSWSKTNIGGTINIWNEAGQSYTPITAAATGIIPATNGFLVQALADGSALTIPASKRIHGGTFYKTATFPVIKLKAHNIDYPSFQESQLLFIPASTTGYEPEYDCNFLAGYAPQFYSKIDELPMMVNSMPNIEETTVVPFTFIKNEGINFSIEMFEVENIEMDVWLLDKKLNQEQNLTINPTYHFTAFENDNPNRFTVHFSPEEIDDLKPSLPINIYAYNGSIEIKHSSAIDAQVFVYNIAGQLLGKYQMQNQSRARISLNHFKGAVLVSVITDHEVLNKKVIVN